MTGGPWSECVKEPEPEAPSMPALARYAEVSWKEPLMARAPAQAYVPFTGVNGRTEAITAATPRLERALPALFLPAESQWLEEALSPRSEGPVYCPVTGQVLSVWSASGCGCKQFSTIGWGNFKNNHWGHEHFRCRGVGNIPHVGGYPPFESGSRSLCRRHYGRDSGGTETFMETISVCLERMPEGWLTECARVQHWAIWKSCDNGYTGLLEGGGRQARTTRPDASQKTAKWGASAKRRARRQMLAATAAAPATKKGKRDRRRDRDLVADGRTRNAAD
ncbi:hypothetical protein DPEC_G00192040 [Dallia pectoralis]|uniref:Uncharacterized protein n=1 Tax=Dallia pectoralis TaxID=75939 RepID=A0ACC2GC45_DALPE|nr:hypothetical protein DPEC_G00192040 [Dallia pectoralis]